MDLYLKGKNILITGAAKGIGKGIALAAAKEGPSIALHYYRSEQAALEMANLLKDCGVKVVLAQGDLASMEDVEKMKAQIGEKLGSIDLLAVLYNVPAKNSEEVGFKTIDQNSLSQPFFCFIEILKYMLER